MDTVKKQDIIIEIGSEWIRIGLVGDRSPRKSFLTQTLFPFFNRQSPYQHQVKIQQALYTIFFAHINCLCQNKTVIILENVYTDRRLIQIMARIMFKKLRIQKLQFALCCITPLYLTSSYSGVTISCGANNSQIMPVCESYPLFRHFKYSNIGTHSINKRIKDELALLNSQVPSKIFQQLPQQYLNQLRNFHSSIPIQSEIINITFKRNKLKFDPKVIDFSEIYGNVDNQQFNLAYSFLEMLNQLPTQVLNEVSSNIVFSGGLWRIKGMQKYFKKCVKGFLQRKQFKKLNTLNIKQKFGFISWSFNPSEVAWIGCSIGSSIRNIDHLTLKRSQYTDGGFVQKVMQAYFNSC